jgi:hypothetical protein
MRITAAPNGDHVTEFTGDQPCDVQGHGAQHAPVTTGRGTKEVVMAMFPVRKSTLLRSCWSPALASFRELGGPRRPPTDGSRLQRGFGERVERSGSAAGRVAAAGGSPAADSRGAVGPGCGGVIGCGRPAGGGCGQPGCRGGDRAGRARRNEVDPTAARGAAVALQARPHYGERVHRGESQGPRRGQYWGPSPPRGEPTGGEVRAAADRAGLSWRRAVSSRGPLTANRRRTDETRSGTS